VIYTKEQVKHIKQYIGFEPKDCEHNVGGSCIHPVIDGEHITWCNLEDCPLDFDV